MWVDFGGYGWVVVWLVVYAWERDGFVSFFHFQHLHEDLYCVLDASRPVVRFIEEFGGKWCAH